MSGLVIPGYEEFVLLGRGGFSAVYRARQLAYDREVAVKVLDVGINDETIRRRLVRERAATGRLTGHPNIVTILDSGFLDDGRPYLTMALCPGGSLADRVGREGPLPVAEVLRIGVKIAGALETAHRHEIVHRDIKPENILTTAYGEPALADFGISTVEDQRSLTRNTQAYTPNHAPPEVLRGEPAGVPSDIYNLGSTLYQLLAGHPPFALSGAAGLAVFVDKVLNAEAPPPRDDLPASLLGLLRRALAKDPAARFASAAELGAGLQDIQRELGQRVDDLPVTPVVAAATTDAAILAPQPTGRAPVAVAQPVAGGATILPPAPATAGASVAGSATILPPAPGLTFPVAAGAGQLTVLGDRVATPPASTGTSAAPGGKRRRWLLVAASVLVLLLVSAGGVYALAQSRASRSSAPPPGASAPAPTGPAATASAVATPSVAVTPSAPSASSAAPPKPSAAVPANPAGPSMTSITVTNLQCQVPAPTGGWTGQFDVKWQAERADNVQLYAPSADDFLGGFDGASAGATFEFPCEPGSPFLIRAVPQLKSTAGPRKDYHGTWPDSPRLESITITKGTCNGLNPNLTVTWLSSGTDEVRLFLNGAQQISTGFSGPNGSAVIYAPCTSGSSYFIRATGYKGGKAGGSRQASVNW